MYFTQTCFLNAAAAPHSFIFRHKPLSCFPRNDGANNEALNFTSRSSDCLPPSCRLLSLLHRSALYPSVYFCSPFPPSCPPPPLKSPFTCHIHPLALSMWAKAGSDWHTSRHKDTHVVACVSLHVCANTHKSIMFSPPRLY